MLPMSSVTDANIVSFLHVQLFLHVCLYSPKNSGYYLFGCEYLAPCSDLTMYQITWDQTLLIVQMVDLQGYGVRKHSFGAETSYLASLQYIRRV